KPFLVNNETELGQVLNEKLPISPSVLQILRDDKQPKPLLESTTAYQVKIDSPKATEINSPVTLIEDKIEFLLECQPKPFKVVNRSKESSEASPPISWSPGNCSDAVITVYFTTGHFSKLL